MVRIKKLYLHNRGFQGGPNPNPHRCSHIEFFRPLVVACQVAKVAGCLAAKGVGRADRATER